MNPSERCKAPKEPADREPRVRTVSAAELLGPARILRIQHGDEIYVLRLTRNDRLILTK